MGWFGEKIVVAIRELGIKIGTSQDDETTYSEISKQIEELYKMYVGSATGKQLVRAIVRFKSSSILNGGVNVAYSGDKDTATEDPMEVQYIDKMLDFNNVNQGYSRKLIIASQLEGKVLVKLIWHVDPEKELAVPKLVYLPWRTTQYEFTVDAENPERILSVKYKIGETEVDEPFDNYSYVTFNSLPSSLSGYPAMGVVIPEMKDIDEALQNWRKMNRNFAVSTPTFKCESLTECEKHQEALNANGWTQGRALFTTADFSLVQGDAGDFESIERELAMKVKIISASTGTPPQHMGLPDELSNRSTADSMDAPTVEDSETDTDLWSNFWEDVFNIAIRMSNDNGGTYGALEVDVVEPDTTGVTASEYDAVEKIYMPMWKDGGLSLDSLHTLTPKVDAVAEAQKIKDEEDGGIDLEENNDDDE